jgi:demethylmenaquinone methyltransferase/2-methoxy-6-polyprenyl-1,4-benzoquinol methylase
VPPAVDTVFRFPGEETRKRGSRISRMFDRIAPTYDVLNRLLSARSDVRWRTRCAKGLGLTGRERVLDACTGTGDLALALLDQGAGEVVGTDFAPEMVRRAEAKASGRTGVSFRVADTTRLPFPDAAFDAATVAFGVRNLEDLGGGLRELARVLKPGARLSILEFSVPENPVFRVVYLVYFMLVLPLVGNLVSGGADNAYAYLPRSVLAFPRPQELARRMERAGFRDVRIEPQSFGIASIHTGVRSG